MIKVNNYYEIKHDQYFQLMIKEKNELLNHIKYFRNVAMDKNYKYNKRHSAALKVNNYSKDYLRLCDRINKYKLDKGWL